MLNPDGTLNLSPGFRGSLDLHGWEVQLDDKRGPRFSPSGKMAEAATTGTWYQLLDAGQPGVTVGGHDVYALKAGGNNLYITGVFVRTTGGMDLYFITHFVRGVAPTPAKEKVRHVGDPPELPKTGFPPWHADHTASAAS